MTDKRILSVDTSAFRKRINGETISVVLMDGSIELSTIEMDIRPLTENEWVYISAQSPTAMVFETFKIGVDDIRGLTDDHENAVRFVKGSRPNPMAKGSLKVVDQVICDMLPFAVKANIAGVILEISGLKEEDHAKVNFTSPSSEISS